MLHRFSYRTPRRTSLGVFVLAAVLWVAAATTAVADWPHWRGPQGNGWSEERDLPVRWSETESIVWKLPLPSVSGATPIVVGDIVFLNVGDGSQLELWAVRRQDGEMLWRRPLGAGNEVTRKHNMSSPSPATDGTGRVFVLTGTGSLRAFDFAGEPLWARELESEYGEFGLNWGYASSPFYDSQVLGGTLFVQVLHGMKTDDPSYVMAVDPATGKNRWRVERPTDARVESPDSYTTPAMIDVHGRRELVISGGDYVTGHDPANGKELWRVDGLNPERNPMYRIVASPVVVGDMIWVPSRVNPLLALRVPEKGAPEVAWSTDRGTDVPTPVTDGKSFFLLNDRGILRRLDPRTGEDVWEPQRMAQGTYSASPVVADGKLYATNESGTTTVVKIDGDFELLAENQLDGYTLSSIAISDGRLFLRTDKFLYCIGG